MKEPDAGTPQSKKSNYWSYLSEGGKVDYRRVSLPRKLSANPAGLKMEGAAAANEMAQQCSFYCIHPTCYAASMYSLFQHPTSPRAMFNAGLDEFYCTN
eukprot:Sro187_g080960.2  (99) ;mRNA; r:52315-52709